MESDVQTETKNPPYEYVSIHYHHSKTMCMPLEHTQTIENKTEKSACKRSTTVTVTMMATEKMTV